ncbi:MAG TPA: electron transfer flavoprotein subunit beta/FixA family protein [Gammaproteobacteria bacterium]|jgi:electron transfer flavoprotein beta subunit|nr:electron transfer flavoprotein subunit beta/FixA family protein [Gammaproteobacteria bacterium]
MRILVAIKRVIDYQTPIRVKPDGSGVQTANVKMSINPFDEIALEEGLRIKEKKLADEVVVVSIGPSSCQEGLRTALAMGADRAIHILVDTEFGSLDVAKLLKYLVQKENIDLVILGKQAIDTDNNQTGQMLAALLDWPQGTFASQLHFHDNALSVTREIDGGLETIGMTLPAVITTDLRLNEPRYLSLPQIVKAKQKPLSVLLVSETQVTISPHIITLSVSPPKKRERGILVKDVAELVYCLKNQAQVLS